MKKLILCALVALAVQQAKSQDETTAWSGKGTTVINAGYGVGSIWKTLFKLSAGFSGSKFSAFGPVAGGFEYGVSDRIGVGLQAAYGSVKNVSTDPGANSNGGDLITTEELTSLQILARGNYHFGQSEKFDPYIGLGLGYGNFKYKITDNDNSFDPQSAFKVPVPFVYTGALGARYYFTPNIGIYAEIGWVSGAIFQGGVAVKL